MTFGYLINDYYDIETDIINKPGKNIFAENKSGLAIQILIWLPVIAVTIPVCLFVLRRTPYSLACLNAIACLLLYTYAQKAKGTILWGNLLISLLSALLIYSAVEACSTGIYFPKEVIDKVMLYALFSFMTTLIRELVKDAEDVEGDMVASIQTFATKNGIRASAKLASFLYLLLIVGLVISIIKQFKQEPASAIAYTLLVITGFFIIFKLMKSQTKNDFRQISTWLKIYMAMGIITMFL